MGNPMLPQWHLNVAFKASLKLNNNPTLLNETYKKLILHLIQKWQGMAASETNWSCSRCCCRNCSWNVQRISFSHGRVITPCHVGPSVCRSVHHIFEFRVVPLPNHPRLDCRVSGLVFWKKRTEINYELMSSDAVAMWIFLVLTNSDWP